MFGARAALAFLLLALPAAGDTFVVETSDYLIGQAPDWADSTHVVWHDPLPRDEDGDGTHQIYRSTLDGAEKV